MGRPVRVVLAPRVVTDLREAWSRYEDVDENVVRGFSQAFDQLVARLESFPRSGTPVDGFDDLRRARMRRFPYGVFYRVSVPDEVRILRVLHQRRDHVSVLQ